MLYLYIFSIFFCVLLYVLLSEPLRKVIERDAVFHSHVAHPCAPQGCEIGSAAESFSDVACQGADICPLAAYHSDRQLHCLFVEVGHLYLVHSQGLGLERHVLAFALPIVQARKMRFLFANAAKCEPDKQGRFLIPAELRQYAGLSNEVTFIGQGGHAEIWDSAAYDELERQTLTPENLAAVMEELGF